MNETTNATTRIEHVNLTVSDAMASAELACRLFGWHLRWSGGSKNGGTSVHVGTNDQYLVMYTPMTLNGTTNDGAVGFLNHVGVCVDDLDAVENRVRDEGLHPFNHSDYDPGPKSFYFLDHDGIEYEVVSYNR